MLESDAAYAAVATIVLIKNQQTIAPNGRRA